MVFIPPPKSLIFEKVSQVLGQFSQCINKVHYRGITVIWETKSQHISQNYFDSLKTLQSMLHLRLPLNKQPGSLHPVLKTLLRKKENTIVAFPQEFLKFVCPETPCLVAVSFPLLSSPNELVTWSLGSYCVDNVSTLQGSITFMQCEFPSLW